MDNGILLETSLTDFLMLEDGVSYLLDEPVPTGWVVIADGPDFWQRYPPVVTSSSLLMENGSSFLQEDGSSKFTLEGGVIPAVSSLLMEDGF
jgi:hypothetical protein